LADLYKQTPDLNRLTFKDARWYLAECLKATAIKSDPNASTMTVTQVAKQLQVKRDTVLCWIHSGALSAANTARRQIGQPRFQITRADLDAFLEARTRRPEAKRTRRRKPSTTDVIEFFPM
jgi:excisionase family DNA binding protein